MRVIPFFMLALLATVFSGACTTVSAISPNVLSGVVKSGPQAHAIRVAGVERKQVKISPKSKIRVRQGENTSPWVKACNVRVNGEGLEIAGRVHGWRQLDGVQVKNPDSGKTFAAIVGAIFVAAAVVGTAAAVSGKSKGKRRRVKSRSKRRSRRHTRVRARAPAAPRSAVRKRAPAASAMKMKTKTKTSMLRPRPTRRVHHSRRHKRYASLLPTRRRHRHRVGVAVDIPLYVDDGMPPPSAPICEPGLPCGPPPPPQVTQAVDVEEERPTPHPALPFHPLFTRRLCK